MSVRDLVHRALTQEEWSDEKWWLLYIRHEDATKWNLTEKRSALIAERMETARLAVNTQGEIDS